VFDRDRRVGRTGRPQGVRDDSPRGVRARAVARPRRRLRQGVGASPAGSFLPPAARRLVQRAVAGGRRALRDVAGRELARAIGAPRRRDSDSTREEASSSWMSRPVHNGSARRGEPSLRDRYGADRYLDAIVATRCSQLRENLARKGTVSELRLQLYLLGLPALLQAVHTVVRQSKRRTHTFATGQRRPRCISPKAELRLSGTKGRIARRGLLLPAR
jgi:hypothetical protein